MPQVQRRRGQYAELAVAVDQGLEGLIELRLVGPEPDPVVLGIVAVGDQEVPAVISLSIECCVSARLIIPVSMEKVWPPVA